MSSKKNKQHKQKKSQEVKKPECLTSSDKLKAKSIMDITYEGNGPFKTDLLALIRSRIPVSSVQTNEERRFIVFMSHLARWGNMRLYVWDIVSGLRWASNGWENVDTDNPHTRNCSSEHEIILAYIYDKHENMQQRHADQYRKQGYRADIYILLDFRHMLKDPRIIRRLKEMSNINSIMSSIIVGEDIVRNHSTDEMMRLIPNLDAPYPSNSEYEMIIEEMVESVKQQVPGIEEQIEKNKKELLKALGGKTLVEAQRFICKNLVSHKKIMGE